MEITQELRLARKRNAELSKENEALRFDIERNKAFNQETADKAKVLIKDFEDMKAHWQQAISELNEKRSEYQELIEECRDIKRTISELKAQICTVTGG